jgi:hypothetical protein
MLLSFRSKQQRGDGDESEAHGNVETIKTFGTARTPRRHEKGSKECLQASSLISEFDMFTTHESVSELSQAFSASRQAAERFV